MGHKVEEEDKNNTSKCFNIMQCDNKMQKLDEKRHLGQLFRRAVEERSIKITGEERKEEEENGDQQFCCLCSI